MGTDGSGPTMDAGTAFEQLAGIALAEHSPHSILQTLCDLTRDVLPGQVESSVTLLVAGKATTMVYTDRIALDLDESQYGSADGPCIHAARSGQAVLVSDARTETRWTDYMQQAVERGCLSSLSLPLGSAEQMGAALNIYARQAAAFDESSRANGEKLARFAGVAVANVHAYQSAREVADNLQQAMESRAVIEQAKGVLVERFKLTPDQAFELLAQSSMAANRKVRDIAVDLVRTGELPRRPHRS